MVIKVDKKFKALLLAGGKSKHALKKLTGQEYKALMTIDSLDSRPIIYRVIDGLRKTRYVSQIYVSGPEEVQEKIKSQPLTLLPSGVTLMETLQKSIPVFKNETYIFIITCDLPLVMNRHL